MVFRVAGHRARPGRGDRYRRRKTAEALLAALCAVGLSCAGAAAPAVADDGDGGVQLNTSQCNFPADPIRRTPWSLQRLLLDEMWEGTDQGEGVRVAVIDSGVDKVNPQVRPALAKGSDFVEKGDGTLDPVGHGTKVAGIIAARPANGTGFVGIAPKATIIPVRSNDAEGTGNVGRLVQAIDYAIDQDADIINISQGATGQLTPGGPLERVIDRAKAADILVVASAGNNGADGEQRNTYPAAYEGVLSVAASDRNNERAPFSQPGPFVDVAAPGVDVISTVPGGGHCADNGTSFAAPYAAGVAALLRAKYPEWSYQEIIWHLEETAERTSPGHNNNIGWGVVDPVAALANDTKPTGEPDPSEDRRAERTVADSIQPATLTLGETAQERRARYGLYVFGAGLIVIAIIMGTGIALRDWRAKTALQSSGRGTGEQG